MSSSTDGVENSEFSVDLGNSKFSFYRIGSIICVAKVYYREKIREKLTFHDRRLALLQSVSKL